MLRITTSRATPIAVATSEIGAVRFVVQIFVGPWLQWLFSPGFVSAFETPLAMFVTAQGAARRSLVDAFVDVTVAGLYVR